MLCDDKELESLLLRVNDSKRWVVVVKIMGSSKCKLKGQNCGSFKNTHQLCFRASFSEFPAVGMVVSFIAAPLESGQFLSCTIHASKQKPCMYIATGVM